MHIFSRFFGFLIYGLTALTKNYGLAIILFCVLFQCCIQIFQVFQKKEAAKMVYAENEIKKFKNQYKTSEEYEKAVLTVYEKYKVNPLFSIIYFTLQIAIFCWLANAFFNPLSMIYGLSESDISIMQSIIRHNHLPIVGSGQYLIISCIQSNPTLFSNFVGVQNICKTSFSLFGINLCMLPSIKDNVSCILPLAGIIISIIPCLKTGINAIRKKNRKQGILASIFFLIFVLTFPIYFNVPLALTIYWIVLGIMSQLFDVAAWIKEKIVKQQTAPTLKV